MSQHDYTYLHVSKPEFRVKEILVAYRRVFDIPIQEIAEYIGEGAEKLRRYEASTFLCEKYEEAYTEVLQEYVSLASKERMSLRQALEIYKQQKCLYKMNISAKITMLGQILYENLDANMEIDSKREEVENKHVRYQVWSKERYQTAFFLLQALRNMLKISASEVSEVTGFSAGTIKDLESGRLLANTTEMRTLVISYSKLLSDRLEDQLIKKDVYVVIGTILNNGYNMTSTPLKLQQVLLDELHK